MRPLHIEAVGLLESGSLVILLAMGRLRNPKRERFAVEVASMTPLDRAYVLAGYRDSQWARPNGSRLAHEPEVAKRIQELRDEFRASAALSVEYLQRLLLPVAEANVLDFFKFENDKLVPKNLSELKREHTAALAAIKVDEEGTVDLKFHNKNEAVNILLRSIGGIVEKHEYDAKPGLADRLNAARLRLENLGIEDQRVLADALEALPEPSDLKFEGVPASNGESGSDRR
jgi:phage terminase small subunit